MSEYQRTLYCEVCGEHTPHLTSGSGRYKVCEWCERWDYQPRDTQRNDQCKNIPTPDIKADHDE